MRIACLHIPQFALQSVTRSDPSRRGAALVVVGAVDPRNARSPSLSLHSPIVQACSRAAHLLGVRVGMTATTVRALSSDLEIVTADGPLERETTRAIADAVLATSSVVDVGGRIGPGSAHLAMYCEVPAKTRGVGFGERLRETLEALGIEGRIGIADDRFTAWVAAARSPDAPRVVSVPRGGSAAFLAPRPLSLLAIAVEVQHMLEALGVTTLGAFAALPAPSVARPASGDSAGADYQALARGEGSHVLRPYAPESPIREEITRGTISAAAAIALLAERIALRLAGRGRGAARLELVVAGETGERSVAIAPIEPVRASLESLLVPAVGGTVLASAEELAESLGSALRDEDRAARRLRVVVDGEALPGDEPAVEPAADELCAPAILDTLSIVLTTTGGSLELGQAFALAIDGPRGGVLDRSTHRRTKRGKQRRRIEALVQPRLFRNLH